jgi:2-polyprenyl-3-methyl-5-hydroxy-6-metoxy-1,4-benzoquinol methylase
MDDPSLDQIEHELALNGLARIHRFNRTPALIWQAIRSQVVVGDAKSLSIMDFGCGDGYLLRRLYALAKVEGISLELVGCDFSSNAIGFARIAADHENVPIEFHQIDVTGVNEPPLQTDVVLCSLFLHHFTEQEAIGIFKLMNAASNQLVLIHDLRRTRLGYWLCWVGVHGFSMSKVIHTDGLLSVRAAFSIEEVRNLLGEAKIGNPHIVKNWPQRFTLTWSTVERDA